MSTAPKSIHVSLRRQELELTAGGEVILHERVSTARRGAGELLGSECTPRGRHVIRAKIGAGAPINTVFVRRRPTGEIYSPQLRYSYPDRDWILTRILWLSGTELGKNRLGNVDTMRRYIYIHGSPDEVEMGVPGSHGCIRLHNAAVVRLFDLVDVGTPVHIEE